MSRKMDRSVLVDLCMEEQRGGADAKSGRCPSGTVGR